MDTDIACVKSVVEFRVMEKVPLAGLAFNCVVPVIAIVPAAGAVQRNTAPFNEPVYPWPNPFSQIARYN